MKTTRIGARLLLGAALLAAVPAHAQDDGTTPGLGGSQTVDEAAQLELTAQGLAGITSLVKSAALNDLQNVPLPDMQQPIFAGVDLGLSGMSASVTFDSLSVVPEDGGDLALDVGLHDLTVSLDSMTIGRTILGHYFGTTCSDTEIHIAQDGVVHFKMKLTPTVEATEVAFSADEVEFRVDRAGYQVVGPDSCTGPLHGLVLKPVTHEAMKLVRPFLTALVRAKINDMLPTLAQQINEQTHIDAAFELAGLPALPERTVGLELFPSRTTVDAQSMKIAVGVRITNEPLPNDLYDLRYQEGTGNVRYGSFGVNPSLVTAAFTALWPTGTDYYDVTDKVGGLLDTNSMASIFPDLAKIAPTEPTMQVAVRLGAPPVINADQPTNAVLAHLPSVQVKLQVNLNHQWVDYYVLNMDVSTGAQASADGQSLAVSLIPNSTVKVTGQWADNYKPVVSTVDLDTAQQLVQALFQLVGSGGPVFHTKLPAINVGPSPLLIGNPHVDAPYVVLDVTGNPS